MNEYFKVSARFYFWDGVTGYTVHYQFSLRTWYVFINHSESGAVYQQYDAISSRRISFDRAETIFIEYLNTVNQ